jgi:ferritin-like metal-binding protein YciE
VEILHQDGEESVIDAGIIVAAQKVEHYEIASYGSVRTFAQLLGKDGSADLCKPLSTKNPKPMSF